MSYMNQSGEDNNNHKHGHSWKGGYSPTYGSWMSMKYRCRPEGKYGRKGITVCERWTSFVNFLADMGVRPEGKTLDRIDGYKGYEPGNCRWATAQEQRANQCEFDRKCPDGCTCGRHTSYVRTPESLAKFSASRRGHEVTAETRAKISAGLRARKRAP